MKRLFAFLALMALLFGLYQVGQRFLLPPVVDVSKPTRGAAVEAVYATGTVEPSVMMPIAPRNAARLIALNTDEGAAVTKDQVLAQLEDTDLQGTITELQARVDFAKRELDRKTSLVNKGVAARQSLDQAQTDWDAAKASLARAQSQADFMKLTAPADGVIVRRDGEVGQLIPANQPVLWLSCCAPLRISTEVDEEDIAKVKIGQKV
jgi:RND family efflux transporter MFP subunit